MQPPPSDGGLDQYLMTRPVIGEPLGPDALASPPGAQPPQPGMPMAPAQPGMALPPPDPALGLATMGAPPPIPVAAPSSPAITEAALLSAVQGFYAEAENAKHYRLNRNADNRDAFLGYQNWGEKLAGQSTTFVPKVGVALEQFASWFKRALTQAGDDWFEIKVPPLAPGFSGAALKLLLNNAISDILTEDQQHAHIHTLFADAARIGATESLIILKVHGQILPYGNADDGGPVWRPRIDLIPFESYFGDPSGKGLYEIHEYETDLWAVEQRAKEGLYDPAAVAKLRESARLNHQTGDRRARGKAQSETSPPQIRNKVVIREFWGTMLDTDGHVIMHNCTCTIANGRHVIQPLSPNPYLHGRSPFVVAPIIRVPLSTHHKALFDDASQINFAINDLHNLIVDGSLGSVWGVRQLRHSYLEHPEQLADGIPQGETLLVNANLPPGEKVLENVTDTSISPITLSVYEMLMSEFTAAALTNEMRMGSLPDSGTKATAMVAVDQNVSAVLDGIAGDLERTLMSQTLYRVLLLTLQFLDRMSKLEIAAILGVPQTYTLMSIPPEQRVQLATHAGVSVRGLSAVLERVRNFQKLMALLQVVTSNPMFAQAFFMQYSPDAVLAYIMKTLQLDPTDFLRAGLESMEARQRNMMSMMMGGMMPPPMQQGQQPGGPAVTPRGEATPGTPNQKGPATGGNPTTAGINEMINPMTGMPGVM